MAGRLEGKFALITGGAMGLGKADCELLAREGAVVLVTDIEETRAQAVADSIDGLAMRHDVTNEDDWKNVYTVIEKEFGQLDILVNNAGITIAETVEQTTLSNFQKIMSINVEGTMFGCKYGIPLLARSDGASIINMASVAALQGYSYSLGYSAAKGAIRAMSKSVAMHCQEQGYKIRCNSILPGAIETPMVQAVVGREGQEKTVPEGILPAGAIGAPIDVANMVLFLASEESRLVTGAEMVVDNGGWIRVAQ